MNGSMLTIAPNRIYINNENGSLQACLIKSQVAIIPANSNNLSIISAVTDSIIMVVGGTILSDNTLTTVDFLNGSGGSIVARFAAIARAGTVDPNIPLVKNTVGDPFFTSQGVGLFANSSNDSQVVAVIRYITFKPVQ